MQRYEVWNPHPDAMPAVNIIEIVERSAGLRILVQEYETDRLLAIFFDTHEAYQRRNESWIAGDASRMDGLGKGSYYLVGNSSFIARFLAESLLPRKGIRHFSIITDSLCMDILATENPRTEYVKT